MTVFESTQKTVIAARKPVFIFLSDITNFESLIPEGKVRNFEVKKDSCRFTVDGLGEVGIRLVSVNPDESIIFESEGSLPFRFDLRIDLSEQDDQITTMKLTLSAELNMMMKMLAQKPLEEGMEKVASALTAHLNDQHWVT